MDWRDQNNWGCNEERNPYGAHYLDGGSLETMEVMFVKVKQRLIDLDWSYPYAATQYDKWYLEQEEVRLPLATVLPFCFVSLCVCGMKACFISVVNWGLRIWGVVHGNQWCTATSCALYMGPELSTPGLVLLVGGTNNEN